MVNKSKEKDSERDSADKKRRKSSSTTDSSTMKMPKEEIYASVVKFEEQESKDRSPANDSELFHTFCNDLRKIFEQISELKLLNTDKARQEINEKRIEASFLFVVLKKLNRLDKVRLRSGRDILHNEKQSVDSNRLQLQNLFYELEHLRKEVRRCLQFKSQDEEIDLISEKDFYEQAPECISRIDKTANDEPEHVLKLARLGWELQQRKELAAMCKELQKQKEKAAQHIEMETNKLDSLAPCLENLLKATRPLQESLNMKYEEDWQVQKIAHLLPTPLYLVYANVSAYAEACDNFVSTSINGDEFDAKNLEETDKFNKDDVDDNQDSDNEDNDGENERPLKGHHHRRKNKDSLKQQKKDNLFKPHPLSVTLKIKTVHTSVLCVSLFYLPSLNFVTAQCKLEPENISISEVLNPSTILNELNPHDYGQESVNPKTYYQLKELQINPADLISILNEKMLGKPYRWAQDLCGLEFVNTSTASNRNNFNVSHDLAQSSVPNIIKQIRGRWQSRLALHNQVAELGNLFSNAIKETLTMADSVTENMNSTTSTEHIRCSSLVQWTPITWEEYQVAFSTKKFIEANEITSYDLFYRAVITRGSAKLECFVGISANYPTEMPLCALELSWNGRHNAENNSAIKDMESWVNSINDRKNVNNILEIQIKRAMCGLDIFLETEVTLVNSNEFSSSKTFLKAFRGRTHSRPFKSIQNSGSVVYTQI